MLILIIMFIIITILSIYTFGIKGSLILLITSPLLIIYIKSNNINKKRKRNNDKNNLSERKEVEVVSSRNRKSAVTDSKKRKVTKSKTKKTNSREKNIEKEKSKKSLPKKILTLILGFAILCIFAVAAFLIYIVVSTGKFDPEALKNQDQTIIYDKDGNVITTLGAQKRESVTYDELPQVLVDAIVATEDLIVDLITKE